MSNTETDTTHTSEMPIPMQLDDIGNAHGIEREDGETDTDYIDRLLYELDEQVETIWSVQDDIREIRDALSAPSP